MIEVCERFIMRDNLIGNDVKLITHDGDGIKFASVYLNTIVPGELSSLKKIRLDKKIGVIREKNGL